LTDYEGVDMPHSSFCTVLDEDGKDCMRPVAEGVIISVCRLHMILATSIAREAGWTKGPVSRVVRVPVYMPIAANWHKKLAKSAAPIVTAAYQVVYYLQFGDRVKIGTTTNLPERLKSIPHDRVLALEPGGFSTEHKRHAEFATSRIHHEWFNITPKLVAHINDLRLTYGDAIESWTTPPPAAEAEDAAG
jgi:hypothetical protein